MGQILGGDIAEALGIPPSSLSFHLGRLELAERDAIDRADVEAVLGVLTGERLTQGPLVARFEGALCEATGAAHAVCVNSGTAALQAALGATGIGPRDVVVTTSIINAGRPPVKVDWRLRERDGGPVIIDLIVEGVSLLVSHRSEFAAVIERSRDTMSPSSTPDSAMLVPATTS